MEGRPRMESGDARSGQETGACSGDNPASPDLAFALHRRGLILMLRRLVTDQATAEDLCQEACRIVAERLRTTGLADPSKVVAFLHQTARNLAIAERRKRIRRRTEADSEVVELTPDTRFDPCEASE